MTPADLAREAAAADARRTADDRSAWHRAAFVASCVYNAQGGKEGGGSFSPADFLDWLPRPEADGPAPLTADNVEARFRAALARAGHTPPDDTPPDGL